MQTEGVEAEELEAEELEAELVDLAYSGASDPELRDATVLRRLCSRDGEYLAEPPEVRERLRGVLDDMESDGEDLEGARWRDNRPALSVRGAAHALRALWALEDLAAASAPYIARLRSATHAVLLLGEQVQGERTPKAFTKDVREGIDRHLDPKRVRRNGAAQVPVRSRLVAPVVRRLVPGERRPEEPRLPGATPYEIGHDILDLQRHDLLERGLQAIEELEHEVAGLERKLRRLREIFGQAREHGYPTP